MAKAKLVYLDDEGEMMWDSLVGKGYNMSGWIREILKNELSQQENPDFLTKKLELLSDQKLSLENQIRILGKKLDSIMTKEAVKETALSGIDPTFLIQMTKGIMRTYALTEPRARNLAAEYLSMGENKPILQEFLKEKFITQK